MNLPVELAFNRRHLYMKLRHWAGESSLSMTIILWDHHHITFHLTIG